MYRKKFAFASLRLLPGVPLFCHCEKRHRVLKKTEATAVQANLWHQLGSQSLGFWPWSAGNLMVSLQRLLPGFITSDANVQQSEEKKALSVGAWQQG